MSEQVIELAPTVPAPDRASTPSGRDRGLWHVTLVGDEHRALCGRRFDRPETVDHIPDRDDRCVVCDALRAAFVRGDWSPA